MEHAVRLRIVVVDPVVGVTFRLQRGKGDLVAPSSVESRETAFDFTLRMGEPLPEDRPRFLGPFAQGPPAGRFVYVNSGTLAGQNDSCWTRRAKIPLASITSAMVGRALHTGGILEARIAGTARDGGPACGTVPLIARTWRVVST